MAARYDVAVLADLRFPGGTSAALAEELKAAAAGGYRTAILPLKGPVLRRPHPMHPEIAALIAAGSAELVDPLEEVECGLLLVHHPQLLTHAPQAPLQLRAAQRLIVAHHPPFDADGAPFYDWSGIHATAAEVLGGPVRWAPVGPLVRAQLARLPEGPPLTAADWVNVLDPLPWRVLRQDFVDQRCVIGRHSRPDPLKWPADRTAVLEVYPDDPRYLVRILGAGPFLDQVLGGPPPAAWEVLAFTPGAAPAFLRRLDFYLYYHHPRWVEAFGRTVLEAMAAGCAVILPPGMAPLFGDGALYAEPAAAAGLALALRSDLAAFLARSEAAVTTARERFGPEVHRARLRELVGKPARRLVPGMALRDRGWARRGPRRVLFLTSNGIGLGHLTRVLAVAERLPPDVEPVVVTMSSAVALVRAAGIAVEHLPYHDYTGVDVSRWNHFLRLELEEILRFHDPAVIVFDGNMPYGGLMAALGTRPRAWSAWLRRGLWREGSGAEALKREAGFDMVLEPGELAAAMDSGPTTTSRERTRSLAPVRLVDESLTRDAARATLDLPEVGPCVLVQLGSGNNYDYAAARARVRQLLQPLPDITLVEVASPIAVRPAAPADGVRHLAVYPLGRYLAAFDLAVSAAGYNGFHELLLGQVPTLFVPNEHPIMDDQGARARWAERRGLALAAAADDPYAIGRKLALLLDPDRRSALRAGMARLDSANGAVEAARIVTEMAYTLRADRA
jgi:UDP:flavonoid glycosyltransferase YjiC (YdhE family)